DVYTEPIVISEAMTIKAMAVRENYVNSEVATASFTIKAIDPVDPIEPEKPDTVKMPVFTPAGGEVEKDAAVTISCATDNATIYYTLDGSVPTVQSAVYTEPIVISEAMTIKAMAVRENYVNSAVAEASFTIKAIDPVDPVDPIDPVANEAGQVASLVVYAQDRTICLSEEAGEVSVYTMDGRRVFCGKAVRIPVSAGGLYIVHVAGRSYKLPVK
ncbi:MAG: chitobiase/beta-hexosaminidase C-terminal domain-containing protein, partial [Bacteroidales bacterium]|nr:chitobiase/beta-hexosaminidase C-terminal domain-containing protein [Bacteroidales bacterium]